jgi:hypothetical protein
MPPVDARLGQLGEWLESGLEGLRRRADGRSAAVPLPFPELARRLGGGLWPGLHVLTGPIGAGKTQAAVQLGLFAAQRGTRVLYASPSLGALEASARVIGLVEGRPWGSLLEPSGAGERSPLELPRGLAFGLYTGALLAPELHGAARALRARGERSEPLLVVLETEREPLDAVLQVSRLLVQTLEASVLLVLPPSRHVATPRARSPEEGPETLLERLGVEVSAAAAADSVLALMPSGPRAPAAARPVELGLVKLRAGLPGWIALRFDGTTFSEEAPELELGL